MNSTEVEELLSKYGSDRSKGLSEQQAKENLEKYGPNQLRAKAKKTMLQRFLEQFKDAMVIILIIAAVISFVVALNGHDKTEFLEPIIILGIIILNATLGVIQESKAEQALEALQKMAAPNAKVLRDGIVKIVPSDMVVPGDVIKLEAGDFIPADGRIIESASLKCEESALTGESVPVEKDGKAVISPDASIGERLNAVFSGCGVVYGRADVLITHTGMATEMGKIASLLDAEGENATPLQEKLAQLGKYLGVFALGICGVIFAIGIVDKMPIMEMFMTSVSLAVAAIPEGLPAIVTIVLAIGVQRMVGRNAIIRKLPAVETLGSASVICSDKTGTLTQNKMTVTKVYCDGVINDVGSGLDDRDKLLLKLGCLCCDGQVQFGEDGEKHIGDPTETSIVLAAYNAGMPKAELENSYPRIGEIPFDSDRKLMTTINAVDGKNLVIVKGAFDSLYTRCLNDMEDAKAANDKMGKDALRVLGVAFKEIDSVPSTLVCEEIESGLTFLGLIGMIDPPRPEAREAVALCKKAGIKPVMITGDHVVTASAIAKELGMLETEAEAISGAQLAKISDEELTKTIANYSVYARVSPQDKIRIVKAWQENGHIVSMTGDGVNDAPALKAADIGCAMGITGTDVAKGASDMILTDDNFATIVEAVAEGRGIYDNIKKAVQFLLSCNVGEIITVFISMLFWKETPLLAIQLLWINLVTDGLPALALGMEKAESDIMSRKPRSKNESIFAGGQIPKIIVHGFGFAAITLIAYYMGKTHFSMLEAGQTMAFLVLAQSQLFHAFNVRTSRSIFKVGVLSNKYMLGAFASSFALIGLIAFIPPVAKIFGLVILTKEYYLYALCLSLVPILVVELEKMVYKIMGKKY